NEVVMASVAGSSGIVRMSNGLVQSTVIRTGGGISNWFQTGGRLEINQLLAKIIQSGGIVSVNQVMASYAISGGMLSANRVASASASVMVSQTGGTVQISELNTSYTMSAGQARLDRVVTGNPAITFTQNGGNVSINQLAMSTNLITGNMDVQSADRINQAGGNLLVSTASVITASGGTLHVVGVATVGTLSQNPAHTIVLDIAGPTTYEQIIVTGSAILTGNLLIRLVNGYVPVDGTSFKLFDWGPVTPNTMLASVNIVGAPTGRGFDYTQFNRLGTVKWVDISDPDADGVPTYEDYFPNDGTKAGPSPGGAIDMPVLSASAKMALWLTAESDQAFGVAPSGKFTIWYDWSGNKRHATQTYDYLAPSLSTIGSSRALSFNEGSEAVLEIISANASLITSNRTIYVVLSGMGRVGTNNVSDVLVGQSGMGKVGLGYNWST
ncbi:hypothetical protein EBZ35_08730, partial [bacterium]|nr:hypothetical protein [bacterium]